MKIILLTQGKSAMVDDEDYERVNKYKWHYTKQGYAARREKKIDNPNRPVVLMHREIMGTPTGLEVDHRDHDGVNNQKSNLRHCTKSQNQANRRIDKRNKSGYKGVFCNPDGTFRSEIRINYKGITIGTFSDKLQAAKAYDEKIIELFGEFAMTNFAIQQTLIPPITNQ